MAESNNSNQPQRIGRYEILGRLGAGGMGVVYLGEHKGERLAIKCIHSGLAADPEFRVRFRREIDACKKVSGLCCARYIDSDAEAETPWLAVEYIPGPSLAEAVQSQGALSKRNAFGVSLGIAEGLAAIHRVGLVHRDLKPSNVILGPEGPRIIDFGVVKDGEATSFTRTNATVGSPGWMAPEQFRNGEISPAADVFTWALLTAFAYTGNSPFGLSPPEVQMLRILNDEPDLSGLPKSLGAICAASLSKDPAGRPTIYEILRQLMPGVPMTQIQQVLDEPVTQIMRKSWVPPAADRAVAQLQALTDAAVETVEPSTEISFEDPGLQSDRDDLGAVAESTTTEITSTKVDGSGSKPDRTTHQQSRRKRKVASVVMAALLVVVVALLATQFTAGRDQKVGSTMRASEPTGLATTTLPPTTLVPTTTTIPRTTTTFNGRSYCNADGIAELLGNGGFENVPARSWEKYGLFTDDRRIKYTADRMWTLAYTKYGTAPIALPRPWAVDSTPAGWLNCQSGRWVYVADALTFTPLCAAMEPEFQAAFQELAGSECL